MKLELEFEEARASANVLIPVVPLSPIVRGNVLLLLDQGSYVGFPQVWLGAGKLDKQA